LNYAEKYDFGRVETSFIGLRRYLTSYFLGLSKFLLFTASKKNANLSEESFLEYYF